MSDVSTKATYFHKEHRGSTKGTELDVDDVFRGLLVLLFYLVLDFYFLTMKCYNELTLLSHLL